MIRVKYPHLHLTDWPFRIVPDEASCSFMADRVHLVNDVKNLLRNISRHPISSMHMMWAWFGAGKTHTLRHMEYLCQKDFTNTIPIYVEFPKAAKNFLDLYKTLITGIDIDVINTAYLEVFTSSDRDKISTELDYDFYDLSNALKLLYMGSDEQKSIAVRWLRTECREKQLLKKISVLKPIQTAEDALKVIEWIIRLINSSSSSSGEHLRVLWILDEYQRIEKLRKPAIEEINGCLHSIFNKCPNGLSIIFSFSGYPEEKKLPAWLSPEIKDRLDKKPFLLPRLSEDEAMTFIKDVLKHYRTPSSDISNEYFPFTRDSVYSILNLLEKSAKKAKLQDEPKPRTIMHLFRMVLLEAEPLIETGELKAIESDFAFQILEEISLVPED